jgi:hypothetical protein
VATSGAPSRANRLAEACEAALARLATKEAQGIDPDVFAEVGEVLFWLCALAEANGRRRHPLLRGLEWARDRITHGVIVTAPVRWHYGSEPGKLVLGRAMLGTASGHIWLDRSHIAHGPNDRPGKEAEYDQHVAGNRVVGLLRQALDVAM